MSIERICREVSGIFCGLQVARFLKISRASIKDRTDGMGLTGFNLFFNFFLVVQVI